MNTLRQLSIIATIILTATLGIVAVMSLLDYLSIIGKTLVAALIVFVGCALTLAVGEVHHWLSIRSLQRKHFSLKTEGVAAVVSNGTMRNLSAEVEEARRPLQIAAPVQVTEVKEPDRSQQEADILELYSHGGSFKSIAQGYKDNDPKTYWTEYRVRQLVNKHKYGSVSD